MAPVVAVFWTESFRTVPVSAWEAAHLAGVGPVRFFRWVLIPAVRWRWLQSMAVVSLLVFGDLSAEMLLHAPGEGAFIGHLFSIMDNSSRVTLAGLAAVHLAFVYAAVAFGLLAFAVTLGWLAKWRTE
jgi:ABC-type Fe3+ transport system permease subunit